MKRNLNIDPLSCLFLLGLFLIQYPVLGQAASSSDDFIGIFLTWKEDPTSTMVVDWHSFSKENQVIHYRKEGAREWMELKSQVHVFPFSEPKRWVHRTELTALEADSRYNFRVPGSNKNYYFRTMPADLADKSIRIAVGGDTMHDKKVMERTGKLVMTFDPDFVLIGGDLAYANGDSAQVGRWYDWFEAYNNSLIADYGRVVPMVVAIGNHEVRKGYIGHHRGMIPSDETRASVAPFFYNLFAFPGQPGYGVLDFGKYLSVFTLDTDHTNFIEGEQMQWLEQNLQARSDVLHLLPIYHIPGFPSARDYNGPSSKKVRENWVPLFEKYGVRLAFENHDHTYKRTHPILGEKVDQKGIVYVGDGSWGTSPRDVHPVNATWYLNRAYKVRAFTLVSLEGRGYSFISVNEFGQVIDTFPNNPLHQRVERIDRVDQQPLEKSN